MPGNRSGLKFALDDGQKVTVTGSVNVYERDGRYQIYAKEIVMDGNGELFLRFEKLKQELFEMGMFDQVYKKSVPRYALKIGVITSPTGAAIRDIMNIAARRNHTFSYIYSRHSYRGSWRCHRSYRD